MILAGTGHRPDKLFGYGRKAEDRLCEFAIEMLEPECTKVISGMALGWDMAIAEAAYWRSIPYVAAIPFDGQHKAWPKESQEYWEWLVKHATEVVHVCEPGYAPWKMQKRNVWMADNCDQVLALWNGTTGGTANCVAYAHKIGKPVINVWEHFPQEKV